MTFAKTLAAALAATTIAGSALAADLPSRKAPAVYAPVPMLTWAGFYAGVNAGATFGANNRTSVVGLPVSEFAAGVNGTNDLALTGFGNNNSKVGFIGGAQAGYNWQFNNIVTGLEADIQGTATSGNNQNLYGAVAFNAVNNSLAAQSITSQLQYLGTVRGRFGFLAAPTFLLYATGGLAYGGIKSKSVVSEFFTGANPLTGSNATSYSKTRVGYTVGAGAEWMFAPNWSAKFEYLYYDLGSYSYNNPVFEVNVNGLASLDIARVRQRTNGHIARVGLNYHFWSSAAPVVARY